MPSVFGTSARRTILAVCCAGMVTLSFSGAASPLCLKAIGADLDMDLGHRGVFLGAAFWGVVIAIFASGPLADRWGFRALLVVSSALQAAGLVLISLAHSQLAALAGGCILGIGGGIADALFTPIICAVYPDHRTRISNLLHAFYPIGLVSTALLVLLLLYLGWTWRPIYVVLAALTIPYGVAILFLPLPRQSHVGAQRLRGRELLGRAAFLLLMLGIFLGAVTEITASSWVPNFVQEGTDGTVWQAGAALLLFGGMMAVGRLSASTMVHRLGARRLFIGGCTVCAACALLAALPLGTRSSVAWLAVYGFGVAGFWPTILGVAGDRFPSAGASMYSLLSALGNFGGVVGPAAFGFIAQGLGLHGALALLACAPVATLAVMLAALRPARRSAG